MLRHGLSEHAHVNRNLAVRGQRLRLDDTSEETLTEAERKLIGSVVGQLNWAARHARYDLAFIASLVQQLAGQGKVEALKWLNMGVKRAQESLTQCACWRPPATRSIELFIAPCRPRSPVWRRHSSTATTSEPDR